MRITGSRMLELATQATTKAQAAVSDIATQLSSGKRVDRPSDDPVAWAQSRRAEVRRATSEGRGEALGLGKDHLTDTERALTSIADIVSESQTLAVQAANGSMGPAERAAIGERVAGLFQSALAAANTRTVSGEYVLGGSAGGTAPFDATTGAYLGDAAQRSLELDDGITNPATLSGDLLTATHGVDVLPMMSRFLTALAANDTAGIQAAVGDLATAQRQLSSARGDVGAMFAVLDEADQARGQLEDTMTARMSALTETDIISAAGELAQRSTALSAAQAVNAQLAALLSPAR